MADLSQLSDEQLGVYRDLLAKKNGPELAPFKNPQTGDVQQVPKAMLGQGGAGLPGVPTPAPPAAMQPEQDSWSSLHNFITSPNGLIRGGVRQAVGGAEHMAEPGKEAKYSGASNVIRGVGKTLAPVAIGAAIPAAAAAPATAATSLITGTGGAMAGRGLARGGARMLSASPEGEELAGDVGETLGGIGAGYLGSRIPGMLPSTERAGRNFQAVMERARDVPVDLSAAGDPALRAQELRESGASMPGVVNKFLQRTTAPNSPPLTYETSRDFASNAGRLSADENSRMIPPMRAQVSRLTQALNDANARAAESAGVGPQYNDAMSEYRNAMRIRGGLKTAGKIAAPIALGATGYKIYHGLIGQ